MDSYTGTLAAAGDASPVLLVRAGESARVALVTSSLTGSVALDNFDAGRGFYKTIKSYTAAVDETFINDSGQDMYLRLRCVEIDDDPGSETVDFTLAEIAGETLRAFKNQAGDVVFEITDRGVEAPEFRGPVVGNVTGNLTGNVTGDVTGDLTGNVTGDVTGNVTGDLTGNVTGDLTGDVTAALVTTDVLNLGNDVIQLAGNGAPDDGVKATLETALVGANNDLVFTAVVAGVEGNDIEIEYADPVGPDAVLSVVVAGTLIRVWLATDGASAITTTASQIITAIEGSPEADALVTVALAGADTGAGVVTALASTPLATGAGTGVGSAGPGSMYTDFGGADVYLNTGTKAMPVWEQLAFVP